MKRLIVVALAFGLLFAACGEDGDIDGAQIGEIFDAIQDAAEEAEAGNNNSNNSNDGDDPTNENGNPPANTDSPNRPPVLPGGERTHTESNTAGNEEEFTYGPTEASRDDIEDFYTDVYGDPDFHGPASDGSEMTRWRPTEGPDVIITTDGFDTLVTIRYDD